MVVRLLDGTLLRVMTMMMVLLLAGTAAPPGSADGVWAPTVITEDTTWTGPMVFDNQIIVAPGTTVRFVDASVDFAAPKPSCMVSLQGVPIYPTQCGVRDLFVMQGASVVIEDSHLFTSRTDPEVVPWYFGADEATVTVSGSTLQDLAEFSIQGNVLEASRIVDNQFIGGSRALRIGSGHTADIMDNSFDGAYPFSIYAVGARARIVDNDITPGQDGVGIAIVQDMASDALDSIGYAIADNTIHGGATGIDFLEERPATLQGNRLLGNERGLVVRIPVGYSALGATPPLVLDNVFEDNLVALEVSTYVSSLAGGQNAAPIAGTMTVHQNSFSGIACHHITAWQIPGVDLELDARQNWWGSAQGPVDPTPSCQSIQGNIPIVVDPWLTEPPDS